MDNSQFNIELLIQGCLELGLELSEEQLRQLIWHLGLVSRWNKKLNLTAITEPEAMIINHILDSLSAISYLGGTKLLDVGSGAGFPGIPIAIVCPHVSVTLLDSRQKRIEFLHYISQNLSLDNIFVEKTRIEDFRPSEKFDTLTARAFSSLSDLLRLSANCCKPGVRLLAFKGKYPKEELSDIELNEADYEIKIEQIKLPFSCAKRHLVIIDF